MSFTKVIHDSHLFLGFLSTADQNSPGNYGILDQAQALKWVYDNIEFFNGDRNSITLFGPGAGAASAGLLMLAPKTKDLVSKVIAQVQFQVFFDVLNSLVNKTFFKI